MKPKKKVVRGLDIDERLGCRHWRTPLDIVAIKFPCCGEFYACYDCHRACAEHPAQVWPREAWAAEKAILCRACGETMTIAAYRDGGAQCPHCRAAFNPGCRKHRHLYFAV